MVEPARPLRANGPAGAQHAPRALRHWCARRRPRQRPAHALGGQQWPLRLARRPRPAAEATPSARGGGGSTAPTPAEARREWASESRATRAMPGRGVAAVEAQSDGGSGRVSVRVCTAPWLCAHLVMRSARSLSARCVRHCWRLTRPADATGTGARNDALTGGGHTRAASSMAVAGLARSAAPPRRRRRRAVAAARQHQHLWDRGERDRVSQARRGRRPGVAWRQMQRQPRWIMAVSKRAGTIQPLGAYLARVAKLPPERSAMAQMATAATPGR